MRTSWAQLNQEISECRGCRLCETRNHVVPGEGDPHARLMFIGEGPGRDEDLQGRPFVGRSGELLTRMIRAIGLEREDVYICNVVKCRPPQNRTPEQDEAEACLPFLREQFLLVHPQVIVLLGATAARAVLGNQVRITRDRGNWVEKNGFFFMPTYHPAALLRDESKKKDAWHDLKAAMVKLKELEAAEA